MGRKQFSNTEYPEKVGNRVFCIKTSTFGPLLFSLEAVLSKKHLKKDFLDGYAKSFGKIAMTCIALNIDRGTYYGWMKSDPDFAKAIDTLDHSFVEFVEEKVHEKIKNGSDYWLHKYLTTGPGRHIKDSDGNTLDRWMKEKAEPTELSGSLKLDIDKKVID